MSEDTEKSKGLDLRQLAFVGLFLAIVIGVVGFAIAAWTGDPCWAARFGSLIVVYALLVLAYIKWRSGDLKSDDDAWEQAVGRTTNAISGGASDMAASRMADELNKYGVLVRAKWFFVFETVTLAIGTLQWGFGDLMARTLFEIGSSPC